MLQITPSICSSYCIWYYWNGWYASLIKAILRRSIHHNCLLQIIKFANDVESQYPGTISFSWSEYLWSAMEIDIRILEEMLQRQARKLQSWHFSKDKCHDEQELSDLSQTVQHVRATTLIICVVSY